MSSNNNNQYQQWLGKTEQAEDIITSQPAAALSATLDKVEFDARIGQPLPLAWHWIYFHTIAPASELGIDGHPRLGGFLPPITLPRRMWAGSRLQFHQPILIGDHLQRHSTIADVTTKQGRSGQLAFVKVQHAYHRDGTCVLDEEHDIVYREAVSPGAKKAPPLPAPDTFEWSKTIHPDPVLLFRYSALTFNGHRIHYDRSYCQDVEGYPGLVVHGPLIATLLLDLIATSQPKPVTTFNFRALAPVFDSEDFSIKGCSSKNVNNDLWAVNSKGQLCMQATATTSTADHRSPQP